MFGSERSWSRVLRAVLVTLCLVVAPAVTLGSEPDEETSRLLRALAYVPLDEDLVSVEFTDWAALKTQHGGGLVTSESQLQDRQAVLLEIARSEAVNTPLGLDRLATWPAVWGWDTTDLDWQLGLMTAPGGSTRILRFRDDWDPGLFMVQLDGHGFVREEGVGYVSFSPGPETWYAPGVELERLFGGITLGSGASLEPRVGLTFSDDDRTVIVSESFGPEGFGRDLVEQAARIGPDVVADSPFGRTAASLGEPLTALIVAGDHICSGTGRENALLRGEAARLARSVGRLRPYEAAGVGYQRSPDSAEAVGRYVFDYTRRKRAEHDLDGRSTLLGQGLAADGRPYRDVAFALEGAAVVGQDLVFDVDPLSDPPGALFDLFTGRDALFAICGPVPSDEPLSRRPTADVPLFVGPATLTLSGGRGVYRWDEIHFGAHEVRVKANVTARQDPCSARLVVRQEGEADAADEGGRVVDAGFAAAPGSTEASATTAEVDYATASLRVDSTCDGWSLRLVPLEDPNLPLMLSERSYPVRGATIEQLLPQTYHVQDEWAAYARWNTSWQFWWQESAASCDVTSGSAELAAKITYPKWRQPADVDPDVVARWDRFIKNLTTHELGHITIALQGADAIDELLDAGFSAPTCEQVERVADRAASRLHEHYDKLNDRYDEETGHGLSQGTGLP